MHKWEFWKYILLLDLTPLLKHKNSHFRESIKNTHSVIQYILIASLLCANHLTRSWRHRAKDGSWSPTDSGSLGDLDNKKLSICGSYGNFHSLGVHTGRLFKTLSSGRLPSWVLNKHEYWFTREEKVGEKNPKYLPPPPAFFTSHFSQKLCFNSFSCNLWQGLGGCEKTLGRKGMQRGGREGGRGREREHEQVEHSESLLRCHYRLALSFYLDPAGLGNYTLSQELIVIFDFL